MDYRIYLHGEGTIDLREHLWKDWTFSILKTRGTLLIALIMFSSVVSACVDYAESLGGNWIYDANNLGHAFIRKNGSKEGDPYIPCAVVSHAKNSEFVIVAQKPNTECGFKGKDKDVANVVNNTGYPINFWIINIDTDSLIGPLSFDAYIKQRELLHVPDELTITVQL